MATVNIKIFQTAALCNWINQYKWATVVYSAQGEIIYIQRRFTAYQQDSLLTSQSLSAWKEPLQQAADYQVGSADCRLGLSTPVTYSNFFFHLIWIPSISRSPIPLNEAHARKPGLIKKFAVLLWYELQSSADWSVLIHLKREKGNKTGSASWNLLFFYLSNQLSLKTPVQNYPASPGKALQHSICVSAFG